MSQIYWANPRPGKYEVKHEVNTKSIDEILSALKEVGFLKSEMDIYRGISFDALVAFGIDTTSKAYIATDPPLEIPLVPPHMKPKPVPYRIVVFGPDFPVFRSKFYDLFPGDWENFRLED
jgi:hypothetical protein